MTDIKNVEIVETAGGITIARSKDREIRKYAFIFAVFADIGSTLSYGAWMAEENPVLRFAWQYSGVLGFIALKVFIAYLVLALLDWAQKRYGHPWIWHGVLWLSVIVQLTVVGVNMAWIPYGWTAWFFSPFF